jgi:hypothetical protein
MLDDSRPSGNRQTKNSHGNGRTAHTSYNGHPAGDKRPDPTALSWESRAPELADWTEANLVVRRDRFGHYLRTGAGFCDKTGLTRDALLAHFDGSGDRIGLYTTVRDESGKSFSKWLVIDIDCHDDGADPKANFRAALTWYVRAKALGFNPQLLDSNGKGGYHLWILFGGPTPTGKVFAFARWLTQDWEGLGLGSKPEVFPKQAAVTDAHPTGNMVRLPGRHPKRDHFTKVYDENTGGWLSADEAIDAIVGAAGVSADLIPAEALSAPETRKQSKFKASEAPGPDDVKHAADALRFLGSDYYDDYTAWLHVGFSLHRLGGDGLGLWDAWSQKSQKYQDGACEAKWASMSDDGIGLGSLFHWAMAAGWRPPEAEPGKEPVNRTDLGNARRLARMFGDSIRYCHKFRAWYVWDGLRWLKDECGTVRRMAKRRPGQTGCYAAAS